MPWSAAIVTGAAEAHRFDLMMKLHIEHNCPWKVGDIARIVVGTTSEDEALKVLQMLWEQVRSYTLQCVWLHPNHVQCAPTPVPLRLTDGGLTDEPSLVNFAIAA